MEEFHSIDEKYTSVKLMQKWPAKSCFKMFPKYIIKRALATDWEKKEQKTIVTI